MNGCTYIYILAVAHQPGTDTKIEIEIKPKRYQWKIDIGTEMDNE